MPTLDSPIELNFQSLHLNDDQFYQLCLDNPDLALEQTIEGALIVMPPVGGESGSQEIELGADLVLWNRQTRLGKVFSSSTIFQLPLGSKRSPDAAWVTLDRWQSLTPEQQQKFPPIAPDFVMELRSRTDRLDRLQSKMREYIDNGVRLGWLVNPVDQQVEVYRSDGSVDIQTLPTELSGEAVLPDFTITVNRF
ncbi:MAG: Uma2 family endonuclease [Spirulina sp.]